MIYLDIEKDLLPLVFEIELDDNIFNMEVYYNERFDYFTIDLYLEDEPVIFGEKLTLDSPLFDVISYKELLNTKLIPTDPADLNTRITFDNFNEQVFVEVLEDE